MKISDIKWRKSGINPRNVCIARVDKQHSTEPGCRAGQTIDVVWFPITNTFRVPGLPTMSPLKFAAIIQDYWCNVPMYSTINGYADFIAFCESL